MMVAACLAERGELRAKARVGSISTIQAMTTSAAENSGRRNHDSPITTNYFFNSIGHDPKCSSRAHRVRFAPDSRRIAASQ
jgi:hypothetical protein